jgi:hypothetical protein
MRRLAGQAARQSGRLLHTVAQAALALVVLATVAVGALIWRLSQGPLELPWLAERLVAVANSDQPARLAVGGAGLAWEGFGAASERPLDIRVRDITLTAPDGTPIASLPRAEVALSIAALLTGQVRPSAIVVDGLRLHLVRSASGALSLDLGGFADAQTVAQTVPPRPAAPPLDVPTLLTQLAQAVPLSGPGTSHPGWTARWSLLREIGIHDATLAVEDQALGVSWELRGLSADLGRPREGGIDAQARGTLAFGEISTQATLRGRLTPDGAETRLAARLMPFDPAALARAWPAAAPLAALAAPLTVSGEVQLGPALAVRHFELNASLGAGTLQIGQGKAPVLLADATVAGTPDQVQATLQRFVTAPSPGGPRTTFTGKAVATRAAGGSVDATVALDFDQVAFADLPQLWPEGTGGRGARPWITENITAGSARNGHVEATLTATADLSDVSVTHIGGGLDGDDVTVHWLRPVPPIIHGQARVNFLTPDSLEVLASAGREVLGREPGVVLRKGRVLFTGMSASEQYADIETDIAASVPDLLALLSQPRIGLLQKSSLKVADAGGQVTGHVSVTQLPLRGSVTMDDVEIATTAKLTALRLPGIAGGHDLTDGAIDMKADPDGLHAEGTATLAGIPAQLQLDMDFRSGPAAQVQQSIGVKATLDDRMLAGLGVDLGEAVRGTMGVDVRETLRRDRRGEVAVNADLARATLAIPQLGYRKPTGMPASLAARVQLDRDRIVGVDGVRAEASDLRMRGAARFIDGRPNVLTIDEFVLGGNTSLRGELRPPMRPGEPWRATVQGSSLDASAELQHDPAARPAEPPKPTRGAPYVVDARFDRLVLGEGHILGSVTAHAENDGLMMTRLNLGGQTENAAPFRLTIEPQPGAPRPTRTLAGSSADAGGLLRALGVAKDIRGGKLDLSGTYDDSRADHLLTGLVRIDDFRVQNAPALARLLKAMTLYGLTDLVQGPGLGFTHLEAPFRLADDMLQLDDARAYSASLGMTAQGQVDLARQRCDLRGTVVPAYFFNSLLGDLPIVGRLFSPERGSGLFAATYSVSGPIEDPDVSVNPLAALTPGFLRGIFTPSEPGSQQALPDRPNSTNRH